MKQRLQKMSDLSVCTTTVATSFPFLETEIDKKKLEDVAYNIAMMHLTLLNLSKKDDLLPEDKKLLSDKIVAVTKSASGMVLDFSHNNKWHEPWRMFIDACMAIKRQLNQE